MALSKAITLVESSLPEDRDRARSMMQSIQPFRKPIPKIGITGAPGVGKSTFINYIAKSFSSDLQVAVLAIDPSSSFTGGSLLGDKTRMIDIIGKENIFIRPSPTKGILGGISLHTWETVQICEAAGFDLILIETVGTGQSEIEIKYLADEILYLVQPGSGDELQGIKKGILEIADTIIVTKSDLDPQLSKSTLRYMKNALGITASRPSDKPLSFYSVSSKDPQSANKIIQKIRSVKPGNINRHWEFWFQKHIHQLILDLIPRQPELKKKIDQLKIQIDNGEISHFRAIEQLKNTLKKLC